VGTLAAVLAAGDHRGMASALGGAIGGWVGGMAPDVLEPATSGHHRDFAHSVAGGALFLNPSLFALATQWREKGEALENAASAMDDAVPERENLLFRAFALHFAAGALVGFLAGYVSHLVLDATTPRGIPLLGQ